MHALPTAPVLGGVVGGEHGRGTPSLGEEAPEPVPAAEVEDGLPGEVDVAELPSRETPEGAAALRVRRLRPRLETPAEIEFVVPLDGIDPALHLVALAPAEAQGPVDP